jgi:hypothetical protein
MSSKTHEVGTISQTMVLSRLVQLGFEVVMPWNDHLGYDLAYTVEKKATHFGFFRQHTVEVVRVQVKTARMSRLFSKANGRREVSENVLEFNTSGAAQWGKTKNIHWAKDYEL